ncbi:MAG: ATP synthase F1 subunit delta [Acidobacteria bacterium]|nr:ATP synthase F1 subunit delta [Acidobacteriota bacterium]
MSVTNVANRYARALADVILERGERDGVVSDLRQFVGLLGGHDSLRAVFASPVVNVERKRGVLNELLVRLQLSQIATNFLQLLLANARLHQLDLILAALDRELDRRANFVSAEITTAREVDEQQRQELHTSLRAATGREVRLSFRTDPSIIGGVVTRIDSLVYDGSVRNQLAKVRERLLSPR